MDILPPFVKSHFTHYTHSTPDLMIKFDYLCNMIIPRHGFVNILFFSREFQIRRLEVILASPCEKKNRRALCLPAYYCVRTVILKIKLNINVVK